MSKPLHGLRRLSSGRPLINPLVYLVVYALLYLFSCPAVAQVAAPAVDWSRDFAVPADSGRPNPYGIAETDLPATIRNGRLHALHYPLEITGILLPYRAFERFFAADSTHPLRHLLQKASNGINRIRSYEDLQNWLGLYSYPETEGEGPYFIPFKDGQRPDVHMGFTLMETPNGTGFTISCAQCHSENLFGRRVIGLTNRFPRANAFFASGLKASSLVTVSAFRWSTEATDGETAMFKTSKKSMAFINAKPPARLGLDTSLAQVALSLAKRAKDPWASRDKPVQARAEKLASFTADSKPAVWWNLKYKNRFLSDGSVVSGNPIVTNILWNELGRGTDLRLLDAWIKTNEQKVSELTTAVFSAEAPKWTDFFSASTIDIEEARRGQKLFNETCAKCHGHYTKAWDLPGAGSLTNEQRLETVGVVYKPKKPVFDVGTDPQRYQGMTSLAQLNDLEISKNNGIVIEPQTGYVPPPLVGIWARWPYFHNNSAPSLCAVLTRGSDRPVTYWARPADDRERDFDRDCNGYPLSAPAPNAPRELIFDSRREGLSNRGHDERIFLKEGEEVFNAEEKRALIRFLQTL